MKVALGLLLALAIGVACRLAGIPLPAPPVLIGTLLVLAMTLGYVGTDRFAAGCRWFDLPLPAPPPRVVGALLVVFMTLDVLGADLVLSQMGSGE